MGSRRPRPAPSAPQWQVILEEIRSQNRSTLEAVEAFRESVEERIDRLDRETRGRDEVLSLALTDLGRELADLRLEVRGHSSDLTELKRLSLRFGSDIGELKGDVSELKGLGRQHSLDISELRLTVQANTVELRGLSQKVDALNRLEERVAALERRAGEPEGGASPPLA